VLRWQAHTRPWGDMLFSALVLVLVVAAPTALCASSPSSWYFRPHADTQDVVAAASQADGSLVAAPGGASYATAWTRTADIVWASILPGDTLFVCGLHESGRVDGALNLTKVNGSGTAAAPLIVDGACEDVATGKADPGTLMSGHPVPQAKLGLPTSGIYTYSYPTPAAGAHILRSAVALRDTTSTAMGNRPDVLERSGTTVSDMRRLLHGNCSAAGPVEPAAWLPGTACYSGVCECFWPSPSLIELCDSTL
jgi:hypothetical protein